MFMLVWQLQRGGMGVTCCYVLELKNKETAVQLTPELAVKKWLNALSHQPGGP